MTHRHTTRRTTRTATALLALTLLTAAAGCSSSDGGGDQAGPDVIAPGKPGEEASTVSPDEAKAAHSRENRPNKADFDFHTMMIVHHQQALDMAKLAEKHAEEDKVGKLADRIRVAQGPEIKFMQAWLQRNKAESRAGSDHGDHGGKDGHKHASMPGMATEKQLARLRAARGDDFDALFVKLMSTHHEGAVTMALDALKKGNDVTTAELATEIAAQQKAEIGRMRALL